jgi:hypothetical protein
MLQPKSILIASMYPKACGFRDLDYLELKL